MGPEIVLSCYRKCPFSSSNKDVKGLWFPSLIHFNCERQNVKISRESHCNIFKVGHLAPSTATL